MPKRENGSSGTSKYEPPYLRRKKPVQVRRSLWRESSPWLMRIGLGSMLIAISVSIAFSVETYLQKSPTFRINTKNPTRIIGLQYTPEAEIKKIFYQDQKTSVYDFPLEERHHEIERLPWVKYVALRRSWPNALWVHVEERSPVAFVRLPNPLKKNRGETLQLIDDEGVFLNPPAGSQFVFPVLTGISSTMPKGERVKRLNVYRKMISSLDDSEPFYSSRVSEVDVMDPRNVKVSTAFDGEMVELQMGEKNFRHRFKVFLEYFETWKREFGRVKSVDLRYKGVVVTE